MPFLQVADATLGEHDENVNPWLAHDSSNGSTARVATGGTQDVQGLALVSHDKFKDITQELQGEILERQGGAMEELQHMQTIMASQRGDQRVSKLAVAFADKTLQVSRRYVINEW